MIKPAMLLIIAGLLCTALAIRARAALPGLHQEVLPSHYCIASSAPDSRY